MRNREGWDLIATVGQRRFIIFYYQLRRERRETTTYFEDIPERKPHG
jgi:hypothetical protein